MTGSRHLRYKPHQSVPLDLNQGSALWNVSPWAKNPSGLLH